MPADLHCHTKLSDGSLGIDDLIVLAEKRGIDTLGITDHDCLAATVRGKIIGERHGIRVIPGVELSATDMKSGKEVSVLCYLAESPDRLEGLCRRNLLARKKASQYMVLKAAKKYNIAPDLVLRCASGSTNVYKQHIMHALMQCGITSSIFGDLFNDLFLKSGSDNIYVRPVFPDVKDIISDIHEAGGIAILSELCTADGYDMLNELKDIIDGVEVFSPKIDAERRKKLINFAEKNNLLMTGGSNFHGMYGGENCMGSCSVPKQHLDALLNYKQYKQKCNAN